MSETPASRLLALLEMLQARPTATGAELAEALGVTERTLRRYVQRLVDMGIPVRSERGPYGGYRLQRGYRLPPLMLSPDEAVAISLGLAIAEPMGLGTATPAAAGALAKLQRVLPDALRDRVRVMSDVLGVVPPRTAPEGIAPGVLADLSAAAGDRCRARITHRAGGRRGAVERDVDPYGVVLSAGRWYLVGHDHLREALRTFRVDRISKVAVLRERFRPPEDFDAVAHLIDSLASVPYPLTVEAVLAVDVERARRLVPPTIATVTPHDDGALLRVGADTPRWAAHYLLSLGVPFALVGPEEVRGALRDLAAELLRIADAPPPAG
jgi:predicted DNA-binding transcriptional regulator YafY